MKKIILVPHTHWDREWYFTNQTSSLLLERLKNDIKNQTKKFPFNLDGQVSIAEEIANGDFQSYVSKNKITTGPLYIQQDTFNVLFGTTITNLEIGKKLLGKYCPETVYMPDTFGFNEQLPQIFKHYKFKNFVAWRGIKPNDKNKTNIFNWEGIDGTKINSSYMSKGYYCIGQYFPYNKEKEYDQFAEEIFKYIKFMEEKEDRNIYWVPLGGDQAPYQKDIISAVQFFNKKYKDYNLVIGTHDDFFQEINKSKIPIIKHRLDYSGTSKIHRTIHSNRYDIKKSFREAENKIYYVMEPLEILYFKMGGKLLSDDFKDKHIYKEILKSSAHDSLGGCNLDATNLQILSRNKRVLSLVKSYIDVMKRDIKEILNLSKNDYIVFNLAPFDRNICFQDIISTNNSESITTNSKEIFEYYQKNISWGNHDNVFNHYISVDVKNVPALSYKIIKLKTGKISNLKSSKLNLEIKVEKDLGDQFDFSYDLKSDPQYYSEFSFTKSIGFKDHKVSFYTLKKLNIDLLFISNSFGTEFILKTNNILKNKRVSLVFKRNGKFQLSRHLALINQKLDKIKNWKNKGYVDEPINFFTNDGLIINGKTNILTRGNNEVYFDDDKIELTLFRSVGYLGKPDLNTRPGFASGLPIKCPTPDGQLQKKLTFNFLINEQNSIDSFNNWNFQGIGQFSSDVNPILNSVDRFAWNNDLKLKPINSAFKSMNISRDLVGRFRKTKNKIEVIYTNQDSNIPEKIIWKKF